ncbi:MerR family transcriptional regulator [Promicromonospora citrea]|uniref:MerR family transcriptional regulator n=1 Tax=Promicromonospora citrea TaxID=43677 RepID=UPI001664A8AB|nr:MerR family transcriptional regulator [Promicromonospora citrea]
MTSSRPAQNPGGSRTSSPGLAVAAVARRLGVAPATLRTWDRRYGLGPSGRTAGSHRRYTPDDVARLLVMRRLTLEGVAPVDAARAAVEADDTELASAARTAPALPAVHVEGDEHADDADGDHDDGFTEQFLGTVGAPGGDGADDDQAPEPEQEPRGRARLRALPGGATSAGPAAGPPAASGPRSVSAPAPSSGRVSALVDAALAYSRTACDNLLVLGPDGDPASWWTDLVKPAWLRLSERTVLAGPGEMPEVVLATAALRALRHYTEEFERAVVEAGGPPANHPSRMRKIVLVFAAPDEVVPLSAHALAAALAAQGSMARIVTGPASTHRSVELVTMVRPTAVVLATTQNKPDLDVVHAVNESYPDLPIFVGLRADAAASDLPFGPTVQRVRSFTGLLHEVLAVLRSR